METTAETNHANRELTSTEIQIAIAQIEDRLMRVAKAQSELAAITEGDDEKELEAKLRTKYDIPEGVYLFFWGVDAALTKDDAKTCKPHLAAFVKGKLTEQGMWDLIYYFEEYAECDYGWIMVERPMGFYGQPSDNDMDDVRREIESIGTRSRSKNTKLPAIAGVFSPESSG
jgi:hypothetical protein